MTFRIGELLRQERKVCNMEKEIRRNAMVGRSERQRSERRRRAKRRARRKNVLARVLCAVLPAMLILGVAFGVWNLGGRELLGAQLSSLSGQLPFFSESETYSGEIISGSDVDLLQLKSEYAILMDEATGTTIAEHGSSDRIYPASLTKIMTAVLALEYSGDLDEQITMPNDIFDALYAEGASMAGFQPGEVVRVRDLLYGVLLPSGAECCLTFAQRIAGSEAGFVDLMNQKAEELGMVNTHFCNSTGLHDPEHYSTVEDISLLLRYALENESFRAAFTTGRYSVPPTNKHPDGFTFYSTMFSCMDTTTVDGGEVTGGKTGYTQEAGLCLASVAKVNGREYLLVTARAEGSHETEQFHILDALNVYNQIGSLGK